MPSGKSSILKFALFATGLSGIVAEYVLSTLATYFLGDSVFQWSMIVSMMLFSMGIGSLISKNIQSHLLEKFIIIEFVLSLLTAFSAIAVYTVAGQSLLIGPFIYTLCICVGILIGLEIPLVTRLNENHEELRANIASVMAMDYIGSLLGGLFFAFIGIPYLGMTYTPQILGAVNFIVAIVLFIKLSQLVTPNFKLKLKIFGLITGVSLIAGTVYSKPILLFGEQKRYKEKVVYQERSKYQKIVITQWKQNYWLFINGHQQLSTFDEWMYHEPLVHSVMGLQPHAQNILILGGGDGCAVRELLKYPDIKNITLVDLDPAMTNLGLKNPVMQKINENSMSTDKLSIVNQDGFTFLETGNAFYDVIIIDLPDPKSIDLARLYSREFYQLINLRLRPNGVMITQAGSPQFAYRAFRCVEKTMQAANFNTLALHNNLMTLGEWGFIIGSSSLDNSALKNRLSKVKFESVDTRWLNSEAMQAMTLFGKTAKDSLITEVNTIAEPVLQRYYLKGDWDIY